MRAATGDPYRNEASRGFPFPLLPRVARLKESVGGDSPSHVDFWSIARSQSEFESYFARFEKDLTVIPKLKIRLHSEGVSFAGSLPVPSCLLRLPN
jgi:hypothetical protein